jgi:DtxR family Mn-dependent transcriptional regulator
VTDPVVSGAMVVAAAAGLAGWMLWRSRARERVRTEDALKHLHECEYRQQPCTLQSLAGALRLTGKTVAELMQRLEQRELVLSSEGGLRLTEAGRRYALRIVRIHRLWERHLAENTGWDPLHWHARAETLEHRLSSAQAESLAASLGHPRYDPHGDPIPTAGGEIPPPRGRPLTDLAPGRWAEIVHIEDEPPAIYARLLAEGLHPGMRVRVSESSPRQVRIEAEAGSCVLPPVFAANLWAIELPASQRETPSEKLSVLDVGETARVVGISSACRGTERRRLLDLGLIPGTVVHAEMRSPSGDPTAYRIRGAVIALRRAQADLVHVERPSRGRATA